MPRRPLTPLCAVTALVLLGGCGGTVTPAGAGPASAPPVGVTAGAAASGVPAESGTPTAVPTSAGATAGGPALSLIDPCGLATQEEFAAALGSQIKQPKRAASSDSDITCVVESAANSSAITLDVLRPDEGAQTYMEVNRTVETRPLPGLGDDAFVGNSTLAGQDQQFHGVVVYVRKGDLVVLVNGDLPAGAAAGTDPAFGTRLATLAGQVLVSLQRHRA